MNNVQWRNMEFMDSANDKLGMIKRFMVKNEIPKLNNAVAYVESIKRISGDRKLNLVTEILTTCVYPVQEGTTKSQAPSSMNIFEKKNQDEILSILKDSAWIHSTITIDSLIEKRGCGKATAGKRDGVRIHLHSITRECIQQNQPILSALVVDRGSSLPGSAFFDQLCIHGLWEKQTSKKAFHKVLLEQIFNAYPMEKEVLQ